MSLQAPVLHLLDLLDPPADQWYYAGRQHLFFAREVDVHGSRLSALALPSLPADVRERLAGER